MKEIKISGQFYKYGTREYLLGFNDVLQVGDLIESIEFNTDTQVYDIHVSRLNFL